MPAPQSEALGDAILTRWIDLQRYSANVQAQFIPIFAELQQELRRLIEAARFDDAVRQTTKYRRLVVLSQQVEETIRSAHVEASRVARDAMRGLARAEVGFVNAQLAGLYAEAGRQSVILAPEIIRSVADGALVQGSILSDWWAKQGRGLADRFESQMRLGLLAGETNKELIERVLGKPTGKYRQITIDGVTSRQRIYSGGILDRSAREVEALVRTSVQSVASDARRTVYEQNRDLVQGVYQMSTFDSRTTDICIAYHGAHWRWDDSGELQPVGHDLPYLSGVPRHVNCRSAEAPWVAGEPKSTVVGMDAWLRAKEDGRDIAGRTRGRGYLEAGPSAADQLLGPGRAKLWREGKITTRDLLDMRGMPLSLADLERRAA